VTGRAWQIVAWILGAGIIFFAAVWAKDTADAELVRWEDKLVCDSAGVCELQPFWDVAEVSWPGSFERFRVQPCPVYPCERSVVTVADLPPAVDVLVRTRSDNGWSDYSNPQQYWECKDVAGPDGIVGIADFLAAMRLGGLSGFGATARFFGDTCP
jgi:hypothetical protein